jgi:hypothetical protein
VLSSSLSAKERRPKQSAPCCIAQPLLSRSSVITSGEFITRLGPSAGWLEIDLKAALAEAAHSCGHQAKHLVKGQILPSRSRADRRAALAHKMRARP